MCASVRHIEISGAAKAGRRKWLPIEAPAGEEAPTKYWLSTLPANIGFRRLVDAVKLRWRIERDYHELK
ncbi:SRSO17 transposase [Bradyrhizobium sp. F1.13.3]